MKSYTFVPGDRVGLLHRGHVTGKTGCVRETVEDERGAVFLMVDLDFDRKDPDYDPLPVYDSEDQFFLL